MDCSVEFAVDGVVTVAAACVTLLKHFRSKPRWYSRCSNDVGAVDDDSALTIAVSRVATAVMFVNDVVDALTTIFTAIGWNVSPGSIVRCSETPSRIGRCRNGPFVLICSAKREVKLHESDRCGVSTAAPLVVQFEAGTHG